MLKHARLHVVTKLPVSGRDMTQMRAEQCVWSGEGRGAEAKAVKEERPAPLVGKSREHLRARLWEKLPDRQQSGAAETQEGLDISDLLIFFPSGGLKLMRKSQN